MLVRFHSSLWWNNIHVYLYHIFFIHLLMGIRVFHVLAFVNNATVNICYCCWVAHSRLTLCNPVDWCFLVLHSLLELCPLSQWCHPAISSCVAPLFSCLQPFPASVSFSNELALLIRWPKYWSFSFSFSISLSNEYLELISFRIYWFDLLAVQGTLRSLLQHHSSKVSILQCSAFFMFHLSYPYMITGKTIALTI